MPDMQEKEKSSSSMIKDLLGSTFMPIPLGFLTLPVILTAALAVGIHALMKEDPFSMSMKRPADAS